MGDDHSRWRTIFDLCRCRYVPFVTGFVPLQPLPPPQVSLWSFETGEELTGEIGGVILTFQSRHRHRGRLVSIISTDYLREFAGRREIRRERRPKLGTTLSR